MKLQGLRVLDLSWNMPGPYLSLLLADNGAEVVKIEPPDGEPGRRYGGEDSGSNVFFRNLNRGKKSVSLDLSEESNQERLLQLCERADVFIEGFRPGTAARLGLDYGTVSARNPRLVYCSISAYGQSGPYSQWPAYSLAAEAVGGVVRLTEGADGKPTIPGTALADFLAALHGLSGVLMALVRRNETGRGDYIDIAMLDAVVATLHHIVEPVFLHDKDVIPKATRTLGGHPFYQVYETRDRRFVVLAGPDEKFVHNVLKALGRPDLNASAGQGPSQAAVIEFLRSEFKKKTREEWVTFFASIDTCFAPVNTVREAVRDAQVLARGMIIRDELGHLHIGPAIKFRDEPSRPAFSVSTLNEHGNEALFPEGRSAAERK